MNNCANKYEATASGLPPGGSPQDLRTSSENEGTPQPKTPSSPAVSHPPLSPLLSPTSNVTPAAAAEAAAAGVTLEVGLSKGDRGGWLTAGDEGVFGWGVPSFSEEVRRSWGEPPGGSPEAVASYLLAQLFM